MKHKIRDSIIFLITAFGISFLYRTYMRTKGPLVRVLCFHDVANAQWFSEVIDMLAKNYHVITPEQFHAKDFNQQKINILITFDDGYQSWIDNCLPVLQDHNFKGLFFINSGLLDIAENKEAVAKFMAERLLISPKKPLTWDGARKLIGEGHSMGGHTRSHPNLVLLENAEIVGEIKDDKKRIELMLNIILTDFAYPFGTKKHFSSETARLALKTGYTCLYSAVSSFLVDPDEGQIRRTLVENNQDAYKLKVWINGSYDIFSIIK